MKKLISLIMLLVLIFNTFTSCNSGSGSETDSEVNNTSAKTLTWLTSDIDICNEEYFNKVLKEKGFDFNVNLVKVAPHSYDSYMASTAQAFIDSMENGVSADVIHIPSFHLNEYIYMYNLLASSGVLMPIDNYVDKEGSEFLNNLYHPLFIEGYRIDGTLYGFPQQYAPVQSYFTIDKAYLDKYGINYSSLEGKPFNEILKQLTDIFDTVLDNEPGALKGTDNSLLEYYTSGYTNVCNIPFIAVDETNDKLEAVSLFEEEQLLATYETLKDWIQKGYMIKIEEHSGSEQFLMRLRDAENPECLSAPAYATDKETINIACDIGYLTGVPHSDTLGIASWSEHPDEAFQLIKALMTDPDVANAIIWGEENVDYVLVDGYPYMPGSNSYINIGIPFGMANRTIAHPYYTDSKNYAEANRKAVESAEKSKIYGFMFDEETVKESLDACYKVYFDWLNTEKAYIENDGLGELQAALHDAGIDAVLEEINRQLAEWGKSQ